MRIKRRPRTRTVVITAATLLVAIVGAAAIVGIARDHAASGDGGWTDSTGADPAALERLEADEEVGTQNEGDGHNEGDGQKGLEAPSTDEPATRVAEAGDGSTGVSTTLPPITASGQQLVRTGHLAMVVGEGRLDASVAQIVTVTRSLDGYVLSSAVGIAPWPTEEPLPDDQTEARTVPESSGGDGMMPRQGDEPYASMTIRVPAERFDEAILRFRKLGRVQELTTSADDVSGQLVDLRARLRHYRAVEERLLSFLDKADTVEAALAVQDRIDRTQLMVEEIEAQIARLDETVAYSTLSISLSEKVPPTVVTASSGGGFGGAIVHSLKLLGEGFRALGIALAAALPFLAVIAAAGAVAYGVVRLIQRRRKNAHPSGTGSPQIGAGT